MKDVQCVSGHCVKINEHQRLKTKKKEIFQLVIISITFFPSVEDCIPDFVPARQATIIELHLLLLCLSLKTYSKNETQCLAFSDNCI